MQDADRCVAPMAHEPSIRSQCRAGVAGTDSSPAREVFQRVGGDCAGEAFICRHREAYVIFDIVVWVMLSCGATIEGLYVGGSHFAARDGPAMPCVKFRKDLYTDGNAEEYPNPEEKPNYTTQKAGSSAIGHQRGVKGALVDRLGRGDVGSSHRLILCAKSIGPDLVPRKNYQNRRGVEHYARRRLSVNRGDTLLEGSRDIQRLIDDDLVRMRVYQRTGNIPESGLAHNTYIGRRYSDSDAASCLFKIGNGTYRTGNLRDSCIVF